MAPTTARHKIIHGVVLGMLATSCGNTPATNAMPPAPVPTAAGPEARSICPPITPTLKPEASALFDALRRRGSLPVIVTLAIPVTPEGYLPNPDAVQRQRQAIAQAQDRLLAELKPFTVRVAARFTTPQLALTVDEPALRHLVDSLQVAAIHQDLPRSPTC